jgi:hypothetical protein
MADDNATMMAAATAARGPLVAVDVFDHEGRRLDDAEVALATAAGELHPLALDSAGLCYVADAIAPGVYELIARAPGLAEDRRPVAIDAVGLRTVVMLGWAGMPFYYRGDVKVPFRPRDDLVALALDPAAASPTHAAIAVIAREQGLSSVALDESVRRQGVCLFQFASGTPAPDRIATMEQLADTACVRAVGPVVRWPGGDAGLAFLTSEYVVRLRADLGPDAIAVEAQRFGLRQIRQLAQAPNTYLLQIPGVARYATLQTAHQLVKSGLVVYAEPNLVSALSSADAASATDLLYPMQWHLPLIGCPQAWRTLGGALGPDGAMGSPDITIAVVDWGVDLGNPAFTGTVPSGAAKVRAAFDFDTMVTGAQPDRHGHGTCCAALATAQGGRGAVCGVAGNCRLIAARRPEGAAGTETAYADLYCWIAGLPAGDGVARFPSPIPPGADIISNSFGHAVGMPISGLMRDTFCHLTTHGRGGRGTVLLFSAGNHVTGVGQDFTLARPWASCGLTISVTASSLASDGVSEIHTVQSNIGGGAAPIDLCAPSASRLGAPYDPPHSYAIVTAASDSHDSDGNLAPNAPSRRAACTVTTEPSLANATTLAVASTAGFSPVDSLWSARRAKATPSSARSRASAWIGWRSPSCSRRIRPAPQ